MFLSAAGCEWDAMKEVISTGASVNAQDASSGMTCAHFAAQASSIEILQWLEEKGADFNIADAQENLPFHIAQFAVRLADGEAQEIVDRAAECEEWLRIRLSCAKRIFFGPALRDITELQNELASSDAQPGLLNECYRGESLVTKFAAANVVEPLQCLATVGVDLGQTDSRGETALHVLDFYPEKPGEEEALLATLDFLVADPTGNTALHSRDSKGNTPAARCAAEAGSGECALKVLQRLHAVGADMGATDELGRTVGMHLARQCGPGPWMDWILSNGCDANAECALGNKIDAYLLEFEEDSGGDESGQ